MLKVIVSKIYSANNKAKDSINTIGVPSLIVFGIGFLVMIAQFIWFSFTSGIFEDIKNLFQ